MQKPAISVLTISHRGMGARVRRSTNQSIAGTSTAAIIFDTENHDYGDFFDIGTPTRLTIPRDGLYMMTANATFATTGNVSIRKNGATFIALTQNNGTASLVMTTSTAVHAVQGDYFEFTIVNNASTANAVTAADYSPVFTISLIGFTFS